MKTFFGKHGLVLGLVVMLVIVFAVGGIYQDHLSETQSIREIKNTYGELVPEADEFYEYSTEAVERRYPQPGSPEETVEPTLLNAYEYAVDGEAKGIIYVVGAYGRNEDLNVAFAIDYKSDRIVGTKVVGHNETPSYFSDLDETFYAQFDGKPLDEIAFGVDAVAGSTLSSKGIEMGMLYAREQYAHDFGFEIPSIELTLNDLSRNFELATMIDKPFIADVTYGENDTNISVHLNNDFAFAGMIEGEEPSDDVKAAIQSYASDSTNVNTQASFVSYDETTHTLVMETKGYSSTPIQATVVLTDTEDDIVSIQIDSGESYDDGYNAGYDGESVPAVEEAYVSQYEQDGTLIDSVAGATVTSDAMESMLMLLDDLMQALNGGQ